MKRQGLDHPKLWDLAEELEQLGVPAMCSMMTATGCIERLAGFTAHHAPSGDLSRFTAKRLAHAVNWGGLPEDLVEALVRAGWLDRDGDRLLLHDWSHHADRHVHRTLVRQGENFADGTPPKLSYANEQERARHPSGSPPGSHSASTPGSTPGSSKPEPVKPEPEEEKNAPDGAWWPADVPVPKSLDTAEFRSAWDEWLTWRRREKRKVVTRRAAQMQLRKLAKLGSAAAIEAIEHSIANDYTGIFAPGDSNGRAGANQGGHRRGGRVTGVEAARRILERAQQGQEPG